jgi:hypothetical protein
LEVPPEVVESLGQGKRPRVTITGTEIGDEVEVELEFDPEPRVVAEPEDFARGLDTNGLERRTLRLRGREQSVDAWVATART